MNQTTGMPLTADLTQFLSHYDPNALSHLRKHFPGDDEQALLSGRETMAPLAPLLEAQVATAMAALLAFLRVWAAMSPKLRGRIGRAQHWKLIGAALATLGSGAALSHLVGLNDERLLAATSCAVALVGGLIGLVARFLEQDLEGREGGLNDRYSVLAQGASAAASLTLELRPFLEARDDGGQVDKLATLVGQANKLLADMGTQLAHLPTALQATTLGVAEN